MIGTTYKPIRGVTWSPAGWRWGVVGHAYYWTFHYP